MPASGNTAAARRFTPIRRRCAGRVVNGSPRSCEPGLNDRAVHWNAVADRLREPMLAQAWNPQRRRIYGAFDSDDLDASSLLLAELGLVAQAIRAL